jgi:hypothetical protein
MHRFLLLSILIVQSLAHVSIAAPPAVTGMFPLGAQRGTTTEVAAEGTLPAGSQVSTTDGIKMTLPEKGNTVKVEIAKTVQPGIHWLRFHNADGAGKPVPFVVGQLPEVTETEPNNTLSKGTKIASTSVANGKLGQGGDVDVFSFPLKKGQTVVASAAANWKLGSAVDMVMQLVSPRGAVLEQNDDDHGNDPLLFATVPSDGVWHIRVFGFPAAPNSTIAFTGNSAYRYRLTVSVSSFANHAIPSVVSATGKTNVQVVGWNLSEPLTKPITLPQVAAHSGSNFSHAELGNVLPLPVFDGAVFSELEPCDKSKPQTVTIPAAISGVIDQSRDEDVFKFTAKKSDKLVFRIESRALGMPLDALVTLYDATGKKLTENDDSARNVFDARLAYTIRTDGDYLIGVRDLFGNGGWRYHYRLFIERPEPTASMTVAADSFVLAHDKPLEIPVTIARANGFNAELTIEIEGLPKGVVCPPVKSLAKGATAKAIKLIVKNVDAKTATAFSGRIKIIAKQEKAPNIEAKATLATYANHKTSDLWLTRKPSPKAAAPVKPAKK